MEKNGDHLEKKKFGPYSGGGGFEHGAAGGFFLSKGPFVCFWPPSPVSVGIPIHTAAEP